MANFDQAYYHNSYPVEDKHSVQITRSLKMLSKVVAVVESASFAYIGSKGYTFTTRSTHVPDLIQLGVLAHMVTSALKAFLAVQLHEHASNTTDRTPVNTYHLSKSLFFV